MNSFIIPVNCRICSLDGVWNFHFECLAAFVRKWVLHGLATLKARIVEGRQKDIRKVRGNMGSILSAFLPSILSLVSTSLIPENIVLCKKYCFPLACHVLALAKFRSRRIVLLIFHFYCIAKRINRPERIILLCTFILVDFWIWKQI